MNELTILLSDTQKQRLQEAIHKLLENEITQFQIDLGLNNRYLKSISYANILISPTILLIN